MIENLGGLLNQPRLTESNKRKITKDWAKLFPSMAIYKTMWLMNRVGPLIVAILLERDAPNNRYFPTFHVYSLTSSASLFLQMPTTIKNQCIYMEQHEKEYKNFAERIKEIALVPLEGDLKLETILEAYREYAENPRHILPESIYEDMILISSWCGDEVEVQKTLEYAKVHMSKWPKAALDSLGELDYWLDNIKDRAKDREKLMELYERRIKEIKAEKIPVRNLMI